MSLVSSCLRMFSHRQRLRLGGGRALPPAPVAQRNFFVRPVYRHILFGSLEWLGPLPLPGVRSCRPWGYCCGLCSLPVGWHAGLGDKAGGNDWDVLGMPAGDKEAGPALAGVCQSRASLCRLAVTPPGDITLPWLHREVLGDAYSSPPMGAGTVAVAGGENMIAGTLLLLFCVVV